MFASARRPTTTCCWPLFWLSALVLRTARTNQVCNELVYLGGDFGTHSGSFSSPGYPSGTYPSRERCTWIIKVPLNYRVLLHFTDFEVEACPSPNNYCNCDYVEVTDGQLLINKPLAKLCGNTIPSDLLSSGRFVRVDLVTDESNNRQGFAAKFYSVSPEGVTPSNLDMDKATKMKTIPLFTDVPGKGDNSTVMIAVVCSLVGVIVIGLIILFACIRKRKHGQANESNRTQMQMSHPTSGAAAQRNQQPLPPPPPYSSVVSNTPPPYSLPSVSVG